MREPEGPLKGAENMGGNEAGRRWRAAAVALLVASACGKVPERTLKREPAHPAGSQRPGGGKAGQSQTGGPGIGKRYTSSNLEELAAMPEASRGATVDIVGKVFGLSEQVEGKVGWQMWGDPDNQRINLTVLYEKPGFKVNNGDYVHVVGTVFGPVQGKNVFGESVTSIGIQAHSAKVIGRRGRRG